ncbi:MAG: hypothetical protein ACR2QM_11020 [Longimicrobiales bacterium]
MANKTDGPDEVRLPLSTVSSLEAVLGEESPRLLLDLGREAGQLLSDALRAEEGEQDDQPIERFWSTLRAFFQERGWGDLDVEQPHPGVGLIRAEPPQESGFPARFFGATLGGLLSSVAGDRVAVTALEADQGDERQLFAFGAPDTISRFVAEVRHAEGNVPEALGRI